MDLMFSMDSRKKDIFTKGFEKMNRWQFLVVFIFLFLLFLSPLTG